MFDLEVSIIAVCYGLSHLTQHSFQNLVLPVCHDTSPQILPLLMFAHIEKTSVQEINDP